MTAPLDSPTPLGLPPSPQPHQLPRPGPRHGRRRGGRRTRRRHQAGPSWCPARRRPLSVCPSRAALLVSWLRGCRGTRLHAAATADTRDTAEVAISAPRRTTRQQQDAVLTPLPRCTVITTLPLPLVIFRSAQSAGARPPATLSAGL